MLTFLIFFGVTTVLCALIIILGHKRQSQKDRLSTEVDKISLDQFSAPEKLQALSHLAVIQQHRVPWYERSLSTIGVVAFLGMIIATGVQIIKTSVESGKAEQLQQQVAALNQERSVIEEFLAKVSRSV